MTQIDTYFDDEALRLGRAGAGLRIRRVGERATLTLKIRRTPPALDREETHRRTEFEFEWTGPLPTRAADLPSEIRSRVEPVVFDGALRPLVELRNERHTWLGSADDSQAEVCLDRVEVQEGGQPAGRSFDEIEIEQRGGGDLDPWLRFADGLKADLGVEPSRLDKLQRALQLGRVELQPLKPPALHPGLSLREAGLRVFEGQLRRIQKHEIKVRTRNGIRPIHKLRVACRRMRAAMQTFAPAFLPGELDPFRKIVRRTAKAFDEARDLDVLIETLTAARAELPTGLHDAHDATLRALGDRRRRALREAREFLTDRRRIQRMGALQRAFEGPVRSPRLDLTPPLEDTARRLLTESLREVVARAACLTPDAEAAAVHALRLSMKRLRYTGECFASAFGDGLQALLTHCTEMQTVLGEFNDAEVAISRLHALGTKEEQREDGTRTERLMVLGAWLLIQERRRRQARARVDAAWRRFDPAAMQPALAEALRVV